MEHFVSEDLAGNPLWPVVGEETEATLDRMGLPSESRETLLGESADILAAGTTPGNMGLRTGLVVGYVQSGKTASFTTIAALAKDNGYRMVIVITGMSVNLNEQSSDRLAKDLGLSETGARKRWRVFRTLESLRLPDLRDALQRWHEPDALYRPAVLITVMKNARHLEDLVATLSQVTQLSRPEPVLIIDDEADQAGLNTKVRKGDESTIYSLLVRLRRSITNGTYLQYTATPQAPLLISVIDQLSPQFVRVITPGASYTGGRTFFRTETDLLRTIPDAELPLASNWSPSETPQSLVEALMLFYVGVACAMATGQDNDNRSMMVHPSQLKGHHGVFVTWVEATRALWSSILSQPDTSSDRQELLLEFRRAYDDLKNTHKDPPEWGAVTRVLREAVRDTRVNEVNTSHGNTTPEVDWPQWYSHILVGGQALDRGYTVRGLTVTYMPREPGVGNADTIQQRARFFGYKEDYLGLCRLYLSRNTRMAYEKYVEHEEDVRARLKAFAATGRPLAEWKRAFFLDTALRPTRSNVLQLDYMQGSIEDHWHTTHPCADSEAMIGHNQVVLSEFLGMHPNDFANVPGDSRRTVTQRHQLAKMRLENVLDQILVQWAAGPLAASRVFTGLLLQLRGFLDRVPDAEVHVYKMRPFDPAGARPRSLYANGQVKQLYQGADRRNGAKHPEIYPGDRYFIDESVLSVEVHTINILNGHGGVSYVNVPVLGIWVPQEFGHGWLVM